MNRTRLLILLLVVLGVAIWYAWHDSPQQQRVAGKKQSVASPGAGPAGSDLVDQFASLNFTGGEKLIYTKPKRDLFRPLYRAPVMVKAPPPKPRPVVKPPPPPPPKPRPVVKPAAGPKPIPRFQVLGFLQKGSTTTAFLASPKGDLYLVKKGERFAEGLLVRELDSSQIVISRGMTDAGVTLKVGEPKTQTMAIPNVPSGRPAVPMLKNTVPAKGAPATGAGEN